MLRRVVIRLNKTSALQLSRLLTDIQPHRCLWQSANCLWSRKKDAGSSSSDSDSDSEKGVGLEQKLQAAAERVAKAVPGQSAEVKSDLLQQLKKLSEQSKAQAGGKPPASSQNISDLFSGLKVIKQGGGRDRAETGGLKPSYQKDRAQGPPRQQRAQQMLQSIQSREKVKLFEGPGLGIFTADADTSQVSKQTDDGGQARQSLWEKVQQEQLDLLSRQPPTNAFEEMIQWTQEGKLWTFPINNEQGMEEEAAVGFHEHVFLENQIRDFPHRGPVRHFMELVITGLSNNPWLTVQQKQEHIDWFRQYFKEKQDILEEAFGEDGLMKSADAN